MTTQTTSRRAQSIIANVARFYVAPCDHGQTVEIAYGANWEDAVLVCRITDQSIAVGHHGRVRYEMADAATLRGDFAPWNEAPTIDGTWRALE
jgi:hypothetical protein